MSSIIVFDVYSLYTLIGKELNCALFCFVTFFFNVLVILHLAKMPPWVMSLVSFL